MTLRDEQARLTQQGQKLIMPYKICAMSKTASKIVDILTTTDTVTYSYSDMYVILKMASGILKECVQDVEQEEK